MIVRNIITMRITKVAYIMLRIADWLQGYRFSSQTFYDYELFGRPDWENVKVSLSNEEHEEALNLLRIIQRGGIVMEGGICYPEPGFFSYDKETKPSYTPMRYFGTHRIKAYRRPR